MSHTEFRCPKCRKLLLKYSLRGSLRMIIKCPRCKNTCSVEVKGVLPDDDTNKSS
nr:Com family DNA-binding transcriptional regulator [Desulfotomaculum copahuensis]